MTLSFILVLLLFMRIVVVNPPLNNNHGAPVFVSPKGFWVLFQGGVLEQQRVSSLSLSTIGQAKRYNSCCSEPPLLQNNRGSPVFVCP